MIDQTFLASGTSHQVQTTFLQGSITAGFRGKASGIVNMLGTGPRHAPVNNGHNDSINICPSDLCGSDWTGNTLCCTHAGCGTTVGGTDRCGDTDIFC